MKSVDGGGGFKTPSPLPSPPTTLPSWELRVDDGVHLPVARARNDAGFMSGTKLGVDCRAARVPTGDGGFIIVVPTGHEIAVDGAELCLEKHETHKNVFVVTI